MDIKTRIDALTEEQAKAALWAILNGISNSGICYGGETSNCYYFSACLKDTDCKGCARVWLDEALKEALKEAAK